MKIGYSFILLAFATVSFFCNIWIFIISRNNKYEKGSINRGCIVSGMIAFLWCIFYSILFYLDESIRTSIIISSISGAVGLVLVQLLTFSYTKKIRTAGIVGRIKEVKQLEGMKLQLEQELEDKSRQMERITLQAITTVAKTIDAKDEYTKGHSIRVAEYSGAIARALGWNQEEIQNLQYVALLHDIGKIGVPDSILNKPGSLTELEFDLIQEHTIIGSEILKDISMVDYVDQGARCHHERYDGTGYPLGLKGEEIPLVGRIIGVADSYDAMTSDRIYRKRLCNEEVMEQLIEGRGTQFDPIILDAFMEIIKDGFCMESMQKESSKISLAEEGSRLLQKIIKEQATTKEQSDKKDYVTGLWKRKSSEKMIRKLLRDSGE